VAGTAARPAGVGETWIKARRRRERLKIKLFQWADEPVELKQMYTTPNAHQQEIAMAESIAGRIKAANLNMDFLIKNSLEIAKTYAGSANADPKAIPDLYKDVLLTMLEVFEGPKE
jgi:hypothetical protein